MRSETVRGGIKRVVIRRAMFNETVEIQWILLDGSVYHERHTCPPKASRDARPAEIDLALPGLDDTPGPTQ